MALPLVTAAVTLFYLGAIPLEIAVCLRLGEKGGLGTGISLFAPASALRRAAAMAERGAPRKPPEKGRTPKRLRFLIGSRLRPDTIRLEGVIGTGSAAATAMVCGSVAALVTGLRGFTHRGAFCRLEPDFSSSGLRVRLNGMISVRIGHIMLAALLEWTDYAAGRLNPWKSTPSKAS